MNKNKVHKCRTQQKNKGQKRRGREDGDMGDEERLRGLDSIETSLNKLGMGIDVCEKYTTLQYLGTSGRLWAHRSNGI